MNDVDFYSAGCEKRSGPQALIVPLRRALRRVLKPILVRQFQIFQRLDAAEQELRGHLVRFREETLRFREETHRTFEIQQADMYSVMAFGWDYLALVRRIAALEDQVQALARQLEEAKGTAGRETAAKVA
jgi:hypothetical protein